MADNQQVQQASRLAGKQRSAQKGARRKSQSGAGATRRPQAANRGRVEADGDLRSQRRRKRKTTWPRSAVVVEDKEDDKSGPTVITRTVVANEPLAARRI